MNNYTLIQPIPVRQKDLIRELADVNILAFERFARVYVFAAPSEEYVHHTMTAMGYQYQASFKPIIGSHEPEPLFERDFDSDIVVPPPLNRTKESDVQAWARGYLTPHQSRLWELYEPTLAADDFPLAKFIWEVEGPPHPDSGGWAIMGLNSRWFHKEIGEFFEILGTGFDAKLGLAVNAADDASIYITSFYKKQDPIASFAQRAGVELPLGLRMFSARIWGPSPRRMVLTLQKALNKDRTFPLDEDGVMGPKTLAALVDTD